ncbi:hypothetical protein [Hymenobacter glacieicola]|uniref:hypothetical protein n=1 Tax=Hymenobacter glacieicola TaxID=1562124 RepID=UPI00166D4C17|nr:hypothetical protein [Hymenobacter glacieicola]
MWALLCYVYIDARAQGALTLLSREFIPPTAQQRLNQPLHRAYPACYALLVFTVAFLMRNPWLLLAGVLVRVAVFDPILNWRKGDPAFAVGSSASTDKAIRFIAKLLHANPSVVSAVVRGMAFGLLYVLPV